MKKRILIITLFFLLFLFAVIPATIMATKSTGPIPVPGMVTMVDLGAHKCVPCKMMAPILEKLTNEYEDRAAVIFIDVWEDKSQAKKFKISSIPTQIFFDEQGKEVYRHQGFLAEKAIVSQLAQMGVKTTGVKATAKVQ
ncbi:MAG: thioredoxin [Candidatus Electrothrix sp. MAN1_4]|nr:thioredoxin [Candidatus Electrothrix sp. MAN1_4]